MALVRALSRRKVIAVSDVTTALGDLIDEKLKMGKPENRLARHYYETLLEMERASDTPRDD